MTTSWPTVTFEDAPLEIIDGDRGQNYPKKQDFDRTGHCLFLNAGNVTKQGFDFSDCVFISAAKDEMLRKGKLRRGDIVLTTRGTVGNLGFYDDEVPFDHVRINSGMVILRVAGNELFAPFLYSFLHTPPFQQQVSFLRTGSAQPQLPIKDINRIKVPVPPPSVQRAIAEVFQAFDRKIVLNRRANDTLRAIINTIFRTWFLSSTSTTWQLQQFSEFVSHSKDVIGSLAAPEYSATVDGLALRSSQFVKQLSQSRGKNKKIRVGDLVFGLSRRVLNFGVMKERIGSVSPVYEVFKINKEIYRPDILEQLIRERMDFFLDILKPAAREGQAIDREHLLRKEIHVPPMSIQNDFVQLTEPLNRKIHENQREIQMMAVLRDLLISEMLSGRITSGRTIVQNLDVEDEAQATGARA